LRLYDNKAEAWLQQSISVLDAEAPPLVIAVTVEYKKWPNKVKQ
jgi:hypothetical protein